MAKPFKGTINVDIRDSEPDWAPFEPPKAPDGAPNVVYIVLDDVGFSAMSCYGGPIETPEHRPDRRATGCATPSGTPRRCARRPGRACSPGATTPATAWPASPRRRSASRTPAARSRRRTGCCSEILGERGWNTYMVGKWHLCPDRRDEPRVDPAQLAERPGLRAVVRVPRGRDQPVVSRPGLRQPPGRPAALARGGLPPHRRHHRQGDRVHQGRQGDRAGEAVLPLLRTRRLPRAPPRAEGVDRQVRGPVRHGLRGDAGGRPWPGRRSWVWCRPTPSCRR